MIASGGWYCECSAWKLMFRKIVFSVLVLAAFIRPTLAVDASDFTAPIARHLKGDPHQRRPQLIRDETLTRVAMERAQDMARRGYFNHVNPDGIGPNYLLKQAGYPLPEWWSSSRSLNTVESICAGYPTPELAWQSWMHSSPHRTHLLGLHSFYAAETRYGVGFAYNPNSRLKYYYVVITAPPRSAATASTSGRQHPTALFTQNVVWNVW